MEKADDVKARLTLEKLEEDDAKTKAQQELNACLKNQKECQKEFEQSMSTVQVHLLSSLDICRTPRKD